MIYFKNIFYNKKKKVVDLGTKYEFTFPFSIYVGSHFKGFGGGIINNQNPNFNIEYYVNKFIKLSDFKGTWKILEVYDGGWSGCYYVTIIRENIPKEYKEKIPHLKLNKNEHQR